MANNLFNQVKEYLRKQEELSQKEEELISSLKRDIINVNYDVQKIKIDDDEVYYPVLRYPNDFIKENETFEKTKHMDVVFHKYTLKDANGSKLAISEKASLYCELDQEENGILICNNYATGNVDYTIETEGDLKFAFHRVFEEDIIKQGKAEKFVLKDNFFDNENTQNEKKFRNFLTTIGSDSKITLKDIIESDPTVEVRLTPMISAKFKVKKNKKKGEVWLKNSLLGFKINSRNLWQVSIVIQAYFASNIKLERQEFRMWTIDDEEWLRNGLSFDEAMELIKVKE